MVQSKWWIFPWKTVIFHSYVKLPEDIWIWITQGIGIGIDGHQETIPAPSDCTPCAAMAKGPAKFAEM